MRLVILTGTGPEHRYVAAALAAAFPQDLQAIVLAEPPPKSLWAQASSYARRYTVRQLGSRVYAKLYSRLMRHAARRARTLSRMLFPAGDGGSLPRPDLVRTVPFYNSGKGLQLLQSLAPDVIAVYGTNVIKASVMALPRLGILNMHTGISPYYRGCDCYFWPLYNRELHMLGATVHECVREIDGGRIFATTGIELQPDDDLFMVFARCISAGADLYVKKVRELADHDLSGTTQDLSIGTEYKAHQKGFLAEWKVRRAIQGGLVRQFVGTPVAIPRDSVRPLHPVKQEGPSAGMKSENSVRVDVPSGAHKK